MKKVWLIMLSIILAAGLALTGCNGDPDEDKVTITFNAGDGTFTGGAGNGTSTRTVEIDRGGTITPPTDVTREGHTLVGWNTNAAALVPSLTASTVHNANTTYHAIWGEQAPSWAPGDPLPKGWELPTGAVWLGEGEVQSATQIRWTIEDDLRDRIYSGELNQMLVYVDPDKISREFNADLERDPPFLGGLSSVQFAMNGPPEPTWRQQGTPYNHGSRIDPDDIDGPLVYYLDHTEGFDIMEREGWLQLFIQQSASGGALYNLNMVAAFLAPRNNDPAPPQPSGPAQVNVMVGETSQEVTVTASGNHVLTGLGGGTGYTLAGNGGGHRGKYAWFPLDLGTKTLSDFEAITFKYQAGDTLDDKRIALIASATAFAGSLQTHAMGGSNLVQNPFGSDYGNIAEGQITVPMGNTEEDDTGTTPGGPIKTMNLIDVTLPFDFTHYGPLAALTGTVYLSIYEHTGAEAVYTVTDITLVERDASTCFYGDPCPCDGVITEVKAIVEAAEYIAKQVDADSMADAKAAVEGIITNRLTLNGVIPTVVDGTFNAAVAGTPANLYGTNGSYTFTVKLNRGLGTEQETVQLTLTITATPDPSAAPTSLTITVSGAPVEGILVNATGNGAIVEYIDDGYQFSRTDAGHQSSFAWFKVDFGSKKLSDYEAIEFDFEITGLCGSGSSRRPSLVASTLEGLTDAAFGSSAGGSSNNFSLNQVSYTWNAARTFVNGTGAASIGNAVNGNVLSVKLTFDPARAAQFDDSNELYFSIYEHNGSPAAHRITNIEFIEKPVFTLADFHAENYGKTFTQGTAFTELNRLTNSAGNHSPLALNSSGGATDDGINGPFTGNNVAYLVENGLHLYVGSSGQGLNIRNTGSGGLGLTPATIIYEITVTGSVVTGNAGGVLRLNNDAIASVEITEPGQTFELKGLIPASGDGEGATRITTDGSGAGGVFLITGIVIRSLGPR